MAKISNYLTIGEAGDYLGVHPDSIRRWDRAGKLNRIGTLSTTFCPTCGLPMFKQSKVIVNGDSFGRLADDVCECVCAGSAPAA